MPTKQKKARTDLRGTVVVTITLENGDGERVKGNVVKSFRVDKATVSDVSNALGGCFVKPDLYSLKQ